MHTDNADDLFPLFDKYGKVVDVFIPRNRRTGESRGFAFVRYKYADEAQKAVEKFDGEGIGNFFKDERQVEKPQPSSKVIVLSLLSAEIEVSSACTRDNTIVTLVIAHYKVLDTPYMPPHEVSALDIFYNDRLYIFRYRDEYRDKDSKKRSHSRSRDRHDRDKYSGKERDHRHRSMSCSASPDCHKYRERDRYDEERRSRS
ncbi:hypothetical protein EZV62_021993 [Acer yangbiense]|uniref:RRM domain-containing protein n=1 Tax=Acer yangbiense TaxID=1000413 RepID=A0A5C7H768_9ROSI|nr:hypothetical protein EZV62_021993 [Acer yangbiense]